MPGRRSRRECSRSTSSAVLQRNCPWRGGNHARPGDDRPEEASRSMISERIGTWARAKLLVVGQFLGGLGLTPNILTVIGFLLNCAVAAIIATGSIRLGGVLLLFSSGFDMLDGSVARATGQTSKFGGFFDSTVDRYSEIVVYVGLLYYLLDTDDWKTGAILVVLAATG